MARRPFHLRAQEVIESYTPASPIGAHLIERYRQTLSSDGSIGTQDREIAYLRTLCRLLSAVPLPTLSLSALYELAGQPAATATAALKQQRVVGRVIRLLQHVGELPSTAELRSNRRVLRVIAEAPPGGRSTLRCWLAERQHRVGAQQLFWEAKRLCLLEQVLAANPSLDDRDAISAWLVRLVRQVAKCSCPPVTRARDGSRCNSGSCGATIASHGKRPSPSQRKQKELASLGNKYLRVRRLPTATGSQ